MEKILYEMLQQVKERYESYLKELEKREESLVEGSVRVQEGDGGLLYYYHRTKDGEKYIDRKNVEKIDALLQKKYDRFVCPVLTDEIRAIERLLKSIDVDAVSKAYMKIKPVCRKRITPVEIPYDIYAKQWQAEEYQGNPVLKTSDSFKSERGEILRSKSELIIANALNRSDIPYKYEYPFYVGKYNILYPDSTILCNRTRRTVYWEHCGKMGSPEYRNAFFKKIQLYANAGLTTANGLILTFEDENWTMSTYEVDKIVREITEL